MPLRAAGAISPGLELLYDIFILYHHLDKLWSLAPAKIKNTSITMHYMTPQALHAQANTRQHQWNRQSSRQIRIQR